MQAASCLLALFGRSAVHDESDAEIARVYTGATLVLELLYEIRAIRKGLASIGKE